MALLSVNLNKIALLRNARRTGVPDLIHFAEIARQSGAHGLTIHPRPDERHIRATDVTDIAAYMAPYRPEFEFNIEGYPDDRLFAILDETRPEQCTLVPDAPGVLTSDEGWKLGGADAPIARAAIARIKTLGSRVILFVDPDPGIAAKAAESGADGIEIYTGGYASAHRTGYPAALLAACTATAAAAQALGLRVNIGHDLNLLNLPPIMAAIPGLAEASIGHELTADALEIGFAASVRAYARALALPAGHA